PIMAGKTVILVGDHKQLPPMYVERYDKDGLPEDDPLAVRERRFAEMYTEPLFETLFESSPETSKTMLTTQYRMAEQIMGAINRFYDGKLTAGCRPEDKVHRFDISSGDKKLIDGTNSVVFVDCRGRNVLQQGSTSFENPEEAAVVTKLVKLLEKNCRYTADGTEELQTQTPDYRKMSMGIITPYSAQVRLIRGQTDIYYSNLRRGGRESAFKTLGEERFMIRSVDDFQGDERDVIILSLVRTSRSNFISDFRRLNVAMSRARRLLVIVGNAETLEKQDIDVDRNGNPRPVYKEIIEDIRKNGGYLTAEDILEAE
ncbi:MAG: DEAD/DEAH box helicase family protein, partial [archaeon]|nr:DEAD/DEAH box helicase family protein [archaeon]